MKAFITIVLVFTPLLSLAGTCNSLGSLHWMLGSWQHQHADTSITESWKFVSNLTLEGSGSTYVHGVKKTDESMRVVSMSDDIFYLAKVSQNSLPVAFKLTECSDKNAVFENTTHDFPKRIEYIQVAQGEMNAIVSDGSKEGFTIRFTLVD
ncbi:DUF6265 family protein [Shewanella sp.]|uniref:DUF6265 family protein n=1 Tax=Shewanella sp. TaxID=50422 RepID=UPI0035693266